MWQTHPNKSSSFRESLKALEADIQHANTLAASLPGDYGGDRVQLRLSYSPLAPFILFLVEWMDYSCTDALPSYLGLLNILVYKVYVDGMPMLSSKERKATLREFYAVIYPSLRLLEEESIELEDSPKRSQGGEVLSRNRAEDKRRNPNPDTHFERDDECGICMEDSAKMVLPNCGHSLCIGCFRDWSSRSQSCPFCRGSLRRVESRDLWVLINNCDIIDKATLARENLRRFYYYIEKLPLLMPETHAIVFDYMM
ncbi:E3 ubiquitin-protein ligase AIRP2-like [Euphorbia lathyris]|uniref:E3 ubiquitin-protein ligase AIRP2-like n=1 Tax=Euphorbia lathyris TaxID=212925 RepID=UPI0033141013